MTYQLDMDNDMRILISHTPPVRKRQIRESLCAIMEEPYSGKPLQEELSGFWSYRVGSLRIVYSIDAARKKIHLIALGPRRTIYKELERYFLGRRKP